MKLRAHRFHFLKVLFPSLFLFILTVGVLIYALFLPTARDRQEYQGLLVKSNTANTEVPESSYKAKQFRTDIQRDFFIGEDERLHGCLKSECSEISVEHQDSLTDIVEKMENTNCCFQEALFFEEGKPFQNIISFKADRAEYHYQKRYLKAENVKIQRYKIPGHVLPQTLLGQIPVVEGQCLTLDLLISEPKLVLNGEVVLTHEKGKLYSDAMTLKPIKQNGTFVLSNLELEGRVKVCKKEGGGLSCCRAIVNFQTLEAEFFGNGKDEYAIYRELKDENEKRTPVLLKGNIVKVTLNKDYQIAKMIAEGQVCLDYGDDFTVFAGYADFCRFPNGSAALHENTLPGLISLRPKSEIQHCKVIHRNGTLLTAAEIDVDTVLQKIFCKLPKGSCFVCGMEKDEEAEVKFSAENMTIDKINNNFKLQGQVRIAQENIAILTTDEEVSFFQGIDGEKKILKTIEGKGAILLEGKDQKGTDGYAVKNNGEFTIDHSLQTIKIMSRWDCNGKISPENQVTYRDKLGQVHADQAVITYQWLNRKFQPDKVTLEGNVRFFDQNAMISGLTAPLAKYGMADKLECYPRLNDALFTAEKGSRVLFYSRANDLKISASALKLSREGQTKKELIKGIGDVRFSFIEKEFDQLKNRFSILKQTK